jgi:hypothetical protein
MTLTGTYGITRSRSRSQGPLPQAMNGARVSYSDATMNLHIFLYGVRHGQVEEIFPIEH